MTKFNFRRDCYDLVAKSINERSVTFLMGARGSGKTICLKQLKNNLADTVYVNFKISKNSYDKYDVSRDIIKAIKNNEKCIFLLDDCKCQITDVLTCKKKHGRSRAALSISYMFPE